VLSSFIDAFVDILTLRMIIEYDLNKNIEFFILIACIIFFVNYDFYDYIVVKSNQCLFFQVFYMHINFSINILLTYLSRIVS